MQLKRYRQNLKISGFNVWCYASNIARIFSDRLEVLNRFKKYSHTTTKHYNYVSRELNKPIVFVDQFSTN